jgi:acetylornithine/succinyldiaminopimelate/putrescine aminotransferase
VDPAQVLARVRERGVLATLAGGNVLRISPALTIRAEELAEGMTLVTQAFEDLAKEGSP